MIRFLSNIVWLGDYDLPETEKASWLPENHRRPATVLVAGLLEGI